ncbi:MAG: beta-galactosidase [Myxococcales bacterium]|nr:beta-galactosidase [Myxococcales bacterium]
MRPPARDLGLALLALLPLACGDDGGASSATTSGASEATTSGAGTSGSSGAGPGGDPSSGASASAGTGSTGGTTSAGETTGETTGGPGGPHVEIVDGELRIDGVPTFLYGGELHYFRVRDPDFDAAKTEAMWAESLDLMQAAGMNLVTTYVPWDFHNPADGVWDFSGARDVGRFVDLACERGMYVVYKPGPLITAEWPRGFGTFGAIPEWWKEAHPEALVRAADGALWTYSPTNDPSQRQPSFLHPTYLAAVEEWYAKAMEPAQAHLGGCIVAVQIDNETNLYWGDRYGGVDYSEVALDFYRAWLEKKYGSIAALNARYGTNHASFDAVEPPKQKPGSGLSERAKNAWYADWYWAGQAQSEEYLGRLQAMLVALGWAPPEVLHFTNDSPFPLLAPGDLPLRNILLHDGPTKNAIGLGGMDLYPKQFTTNDHLLDQPFQPDYFTRLYDHYGDLATGPQGYTYAAEIQGGFYKYPVLGHPNVRPEATDQTLARSIGRGLKGGAFYVIRDGLNLDGSAYDYLAAIKADGSTGPRYPVVKRWGEMLAEHGQDLLRAEEVVDAVAILNEGRHAAPQGGLLEDMQRLYAIENPALFGWLAHAGLNPAVVDARLVDAAALAKYKVVFFQNPDFVAPETAELLADYVDGGGVLVNLLWPGRFADDWKASPATDHLSQVLFPAPEDGYWIWPNASRSGDFNLDLAGEHVPYESYWYVSFWQEGAPIEPFAWERTQPFGDDGSVVGYLVDDADGKRAFIGANVFTRYNQDDYFALSDALLADGRAFARQLAALGGVTPAVSAEGLHHLAWARRSDARIYLFVLNDSDATADVSVRIDDGDAVGIDPGASYAVRELLGGVDLGSKDGAAILSGGVKVKVPAWSSAVVGLTPG